MRGKIVVLTMLLAAAALFVFSLWYTNTHTPLDEQFNMRRKALAVDAPGGLILQELVEDYHRVSFDPGTLDTPGTLRHGTAVYRDAQDNPLKLEVQAMSGQSPALQDLFAGFGDRAGGKDAGATAIKLHPESSIPYGYGVYSATTYVYYEFTWINGDWIIRVSTREASGESLLRFANSYPF
jgi:hypothetical protein